MADPDRRKAGIAKKLDVDMKDLLNLTKKSMSISS